MSDVKIDSSLVRIGTGPKTVIKEQPAKEIEDLPQLYVTIDPSTARAKEMRAQLAQLKINPVNPRVAEQDVTSVKMSPDISEPVLQHILLWPLREIACKILSTKGGGATYIGRKGSLNTLFFIFSKLFSKNEYGYAGIWEGSYVNQGLSDDIRCAVPLPNILTIALCMDPNTLPESKYRPQSVSDKADQIYYSIKPWSEVIGLNEKHEDWLDGDIRKRDYVWPEEFLRELLRLRSGDITYLDGKAHILTDPEKHPVFNSVIDLSSYTLSFGKDERGIYLSVYDIWDFKIGAGKYCKNFGYNFIEKVEPRIMALITKPVYIYDRYYISEKDIKNELDRRVHEKITKEKQCP